MSRLRRWDFEQRVRSGEEKEGLCGSIIHASWLRRSEETQIPFGNDKQKGHMGGPPIRLGLRLAQGRLFGAQAAFARHDSGADARLRHRIADEVALDGVAGSEHGVIVGQGDLEGAREGVELGGGEGGDIAGLGIRIPSCIDLLLGKIFVCGFEAPEEIREGHILFKSVMGRIGGRAQHGGRSGEVLIAAIQEIEEMVLHLIAESGGE